MPLKNIDALREKVGSVANRLPWHGLPSQDRETIVRDISALLDSLDADSPMRPGLETATAQLQQAVVDSGTLKDLIVTVDKLREILKG